MDRATQPPGPPSTDRSAVGRGGAAATPLNPPPLWEITGGRRGTRRAGRAMAAADFAVAAVAAGKKNGLFLDSGNQISEKYIIRAVITIVTLKVLGGFGETPADQPLGHNAFAQGPSPKLADYPVGRFASCTLSQSKCITIGRPFG